MYSLYHRHAKTGGFIELALENFLEDSLGLFFGVSMLYLYSAVSWVAGECR